MEPGTFKIKKAFLVPFLILVALLGLLLFLSLFQGPSWEKFVLAVAFAGTLLVGIEALEREVTIIQDALRIKKFFRSKEITWSDIMHVAVVDLNKKAYFLLTTTKGFYFFSNMYENHALLLRSIVDKLDAEKTEPEVRTYLEHPHERRSLIVICWLTIFIIIAFMILKLLSSQAHMPVILK